MAAVAAVRGIVSGQRSANCRTYRLDMGQWNPRGTKKKRARADAVAATRAY